jgi:RNA polymerase sigma factor (sigma-70 family)
MASRPLNTLIRQLRRAVCPQAPDGLTDAQLLDRFVQRRDEAAFEILVWRHGAMVFGVCRRVLHHEQDAEDAFQATFLTLARKAASISSRASLSPWLHKVAYRIALRARTTAPTLPFPEQPLCDRAADPALPLLAQEFGAVLDEEVNALAEKYRVAFVLCQLEGQTIEATARLLGWAPGTVGTRVARARQLVRLRLARRGYLADPCAVALVVPPVPLVGATVQAALLKTVAQAVAAGVISEHVANLTNGVLRTMFLTRWIPIVAVLTLGLFGVALRAQRADIDPRSAADHGLIAPASAEPIPVALRPEAPEKEADVTLAWNFVKDQPFYQEITSETRHIIDLRGSDPKEPPAAGSAPQRHSEHRQTQTFFFSWTPLRKEGDSWVLRQKIEAIKFDLEIGGNKISFDSTLDKQTEGGVLDFYRALIGTELTVTLNRQYQVEKIQGREELHKKMLAAHPSMGTLLGQVLGEEALRYVAETSFAGLPRGPVRIGDSWIARRKLDVSRAGAFEVTYRYTYTGTQDRLDRIKIQVEDVRSSRPAAEGAGPVKIANLTVKSSESSGTLLFDREKGRAVSLELSLKMEAKLFPGDQHSEMDLIQTTKTTVKTLDVNPIKAVAPPNDKDQEIQRLREENERLRRQLKAVEEALRGERRPQE